MRLRIVGRLYGLIALFAIGCAMLAAGLIWLQSRQAADARQRELTHLVDSAIRVLESQHKLAQSGAVSEQEAKNRLWRREINKVGQDGHYTHRTNPGPNTLIIDRYENFEGVGVVLAARFAATIEPLTAARLADLAIESARLERTGRDGITYLIDTKRNGITTPLSAAYEQEILRRTKARDLNEALWKIRTES